MQFVDYVDELPNNGLAVIFDKMKFFYSVLIPLWFGTDALSQ